MFQKVYLDGTGVQSRTWNHVKKGQKVGQGLLHGLRSWNLILGLGWLQDPSGAVWEKGKEPGSWKPGVRESLGSWGQHLSAMLMTLLSLAASHGEDTVLEHQWFSRDPPPKIPHQPTEARQQAFQQQWGQRQDARVAMTWAAEAKPSREGRHKANPSQEGEDFPKLGMQ